MNYSLSEKAIILLDSLEGLEYKHKAAILFRAGKPENLFDICLRRGNALNGIIDEAKIQTVFAAFDEDYAEYTLEKYEKENTTVITRGSENYPESLENISAPPLCLYCNGDVTLLKSKCFAIVGSRKCPPYATALIKEHSEVLVKSGVTIVTGSAGGADKAAIEGSLAGGGKVISVLAGGIKHVYPEYNKNLIKEVEKKGLVVSEHNPFVAPKPWMFPVRNRIIAGLSEGVLIAAGERQSGARHTATFALEYGKEVFAYPYSIGISSGELNNELIKDGASLCDCADDILSFLEIERKTEEEEVELEDEEKEVLSAIKDGFDDVNKLVEKTGLKMYELAPALSSLEISGFIVKTAGNVYKAVK